MVTLGARQDSYDCSACVRARPDYAELLSAVVPGTEVTVQKWLTHPHSLFLALCSALIQC